MKKTALIFVTLFLLLTPQTAGANQNQPDKATVAFFVKGMECENCKSKVEKNMAFEKGVTDLKCDLKSKTVEITYKKNKTSPEKLLKGFLKIKMPAIVMPLDSVSIQNQNIE